MRLMHIHVLVESSMIRRASHVIVARARRRRMLLHDGRRGRRLLSVLLANVEVSRAIVVCAHLRAGRRSAVQRVDGAVLRQLTLMRAHKLQLEGRLLGSASRLLLVRRSHEACAGLLLLAAC